VEYLYILVHIIMKQNDKKFIIHVLVIIIIFNYFYAFLKLILAR